jgi:predicted KAP-like P-loop ATPase
MKEKHFKNHEEAIHAIISDAWELTNKPHRFIFTMIKVVEQFFDAEKAYVSKSQKKVIINALWRVYKTGLLNPYGRIWDLEHEIKILKKKVIYPTK